MLTTGLLMSEVIKPATAAAAPEPYGIDDALAELFLERSALECLITIWRGKRNLILQGAPCVWLYSW